MTAIITEKFRLHNAEQFYESFSEAAPHVYYMLIGKATPFTAATSGGTDALPPTPADDVSSEFYVWDQTIAGKKITSSDVTYAVPRRDWANSTTYDMYEDNVSSSNLTASGQASVYQSTFFFRTSDNRVYKVMDNNGGTAYSGSEPTSESTSPFAQGGYILKYMYTITAAEQTKFLTTDFMPVSTDSAVSAAATDGKIESLIVTGGSGYTDGTYYVAVNGDGSSAGTSSGAIVSFVVSSNAIADFGLTSGTDTIVYAGGTGYTYGTVTLTDATVFTDATLETAASSGYIDNGSGGAIQVMVGPKSGHGYNAVTELGGHYILMNTLFIGAERDDLLTANDFRNIGIVTSPTTYGTSSVGAYVAFSGANAITGASSSAVGTPDSTADTAVTLSGGFTITFSDGYCNPELQPDSGNIIYNENRSPISRATDQTEDIKIIVEF